MTVFYRKYRPQKIEDLDLLEIKKKISIVLSSKRIPHAFLLTGPRGLGKTSTARIIAKSINCLKKGENGEPCGKCETCVSITNGSNLDVLEMDGASNRGIDEIRDLKEKIKLAPTKEKFKVYIIDEVHMLTNEAFNALLKTLEEPPEHAVFILCTTDPQKIPETISSRCTRFVFSYPLESEIINSLTRVVAAEGLKAEAGVLTDIARMAKGSFRDGQKILDQLSLEGKTITPEMINAFEGKKKGFSEKEFFSHIANKDTKKAINWINETVGQGLDVRMWTETCLRYFHEVLIFKAAGIKASDKDKEVIEILLVLSTSEIRALIELWEKAYQELKISAILQLPLEMAVIDWGENEAQSAPKNTYLAPKITGSLARSVSTGQAKFPYRVNKVQSQVQSEKPEKNDRAEEEEVQPKKQDTRTSEKTEDKNREVQKAVSQKTTDDILGIWPTILSTVKPFNHSVEALLRSSRPISLEENILTIEVFYKFHKERLEEPKIFELLCDTISNLFGKKTRVKYILGEKRKPAVENMAGVAEEIFAS